jgi:cyanophycinase
MKHPKGLIVLAGGAKQINTDLGKPQEISASEAAFIQFVIGLVENGQDPKIELVTTASAFPENNEQLYRNTFIKLGCTNVNFLNIQSRKDVEDPAYLQRLIDCNIVIFNCMDQLRLCSIYGGSEFLEIIKERYHNEYFIIAGTNAAAMAMSHIMIYGENSNQTHLKGKVKMGTGFGLLPNMIIDTMIETHGRFNRLTQAVATQPGIIGLGLGENTGALITRGSEVRPIGSGIITIIDGSQITHNNIADVKRGQPVSVRNLSVHILSSKDVFDINIHRYSHAENG